jgi:hypothetical protein
MNVTQAMDALEAVASAVFLEDPGETTDREGNSKRLKEAIEDMLQANKLHLGTKMNEPDRSSAKCKVYVFSLTSFFSFHF